MFPAAMEMSKSNQPSGFTAQFKGHSRVWVGIGSIAVHVADSQRTDHFPATQHQRMSVEVAARFVPGANGVARNPAFTFASPGVLHSEVLLTLSFEIVDHIQILSLHPTQEHI